MPNDNNKARLAGSMAIPRGLVDIAKVKKDLTIKFKPMGEEIAQEVIAYRLTPTHIEVPRQYGIALCNENGIEYEDCTSAGVPITFPKILTPRDYQLEGLSRIAEAFENNYDLVFRARVAYGKTAVALITAARLGVSTVVIVDQENLRDQWIDYLVTHFGFAREDVGIIQGKVCSYEGKAVTIAMLQTLSRKGIPQEMKDAFGHLIYDEVHVAAGPVVSKVLMEFSASYRWGVSATPKRRDGLQKLLDYNLGPVRVYIDDEHDSSAVYVAEHDGIYSQYANQSPKIGRFITEVSEDASRNLLVAEAAVYLYDTGRDILVLSDRIEQLVHLKNLCYYLGIPENEIGVYAGYDMKYGYEKDPTPFRRPEGYVRGTEYTPVRLGLISKKSKKVDLERIKSECRIIFSTYGKFSKGVDVPRLSGGIDATPRSKSEQEHGRTLRKLDGKLRPVWITFADVNSYRSLFGLTARLSDYTKNNAVVSKWSLENGKSKCTPSVKELKAELFDRIEKLKSSLVVKQQDGQYMLQTPQQRMQQEKRAAMLITERSTAATPRSPSATITTTSAPRRAGMVTRAVRTAPKD